MVVSRAKRMKMNNNNKKNTGWRKKWKQAKMQIFFFVILGVKNDISLHNTGKFDL